LDLGVCGNRRLVIAKSPAAAVCWLPFTITTSGFELRPGPAARMQGNFWNRVISVGPGLSAQSQSALVLEAQRHPIALPP